MDPNSFSNVAFFQWVILPVLIFFARIADVSLGTMRIIFLSRGRRRLAPFLGFFEVFIWIIAVSQLVRNLSNVAGYLAYASGFAVGTIVGLWLEDRLALGTVSVQTILQNHGENLVCMLRDSGYGVTTIEGKGATGPVTIILSIIPRKELHLAIRQIKALYPKAFVSIEEVRSASEGIFPHHQPRSPLYGLLIRK